MHVSASTQAGSRSRSGLQEHEWHGARQTVRRWSVMRCSATQQEAPSIPTSSSSIAMGTTALKEWSVACSALGRGQQTVRCTHSLLHLHRSEEANMPGPSAPLVIYHIAPMVSIPVCHMSLLETICRCYFGKEASKNRHSSLKPHASSCFPRLSTQRARFCSQAWRRDMPRYTVLVIRLNL